MKYIKQIAITFFFFTLFACYNTAQQSEIDRIKKHIDYLASEELQGRKPGTEGGKLAGNYIIKCFEDLDLQLLGDNGKQYFEFVEGSELGNNNKLIVGKNENELKKEYIPANFSANTTVKANVVFAGFGISVDLEDVKWDDYKNTDVNGKWVLLLRADPELDKQDSKLIKYGEDRHKCYTAKDKGAAGVLLVQGKELSEKDVLPEPRKNTIASNAGIPVIYITREVANKILAEQNKKIEVIEKDLIENRNPQPFEISTTVEATVDIVEKRAKTSNIVAKIEAKHKKATDEYIIIGAHYDHLGMGGTGSSSRKPDTVAVHNGADDNASGVAAIIELANRLKEIDSKLKRDIVIVAFGGEEMGLLGSKFYVDEPFLPLEDAVLMMNFDMVGRFDKEKNALVIGGIGTAVELEKLTEKQKKANKFNINFSKNGYGPSDHASFYSEKIPVLFFFTGTHADYHTPFDDVEKLNLEGISTVIDYAFDVIKDVVSYKEKLTYIETEDNTKRSRRMNLKVTLGIIPDMAATVETGLKVGGVKKGGPAHGGGMLKDDIIIAINGKEVKDIYEYMFRLQELNKGQRINVEVIRGDSKEILIIDL